jgi:hypothetical protein
MKNEKMIILAQILEKGKDYFIYGFKGAELQETTVCHAEENANINDISKVVFEEGRGTQTPYTFSLTPIREMDFSIYDDSKVSLNGIVESPEFKDLVKNAFTRNLLLKLSNKVSVGLPVTLFKLLRGQMS